MRRYLLFDSHCSKCSNIALAIEKEAGDKLEATSLYDEKARELLERIYPNGWEYLPYLVTISRDYVRGWKGLGLAVQLAKLLGPRKALKVWGIANDSHTTQAETPSIVNASSRRSFLKGGVLALMAALTTQVIHPSSVAFACVPCETCSVRCRLVRYCVTQKVCGSSTQWDKCSLYKCYDGRTGELCEAYWDCCCDCSGCV